MRVKSKGTQTILLMFTLAPEAIIECALSPLIPFIIRALSKDVASEELERVIGGRSGMLTAVFYFPLLIMNIVWGTLSDSVGRKPILIMGLFVCGLTIFILGINTTSFTVALLCRFAAGLFGGNSTVAKGAVGEIWEDDDGRSWGYAAYGALYAVAGISGPLLGGFFVSISEKSQDEDIRYLNICLFGAFLSFAFLIISQLFLVEPKELKRFKSNMPIHLNDFDDPGDERSSYLQSLSRICSPQGLLLQYRALKDPVTPRLVFPIVLYVCIAFCSMSWQTLLPLLFAAKPEYGGMGLTPLEASVAMSMPAFTKLFCQFFISQRMIRAFGPLGSFGVGMLAIIPATLGLGLLGGSRAAADAAWYWTLAFMCILGFAEAIAYMCTNMMISNAVSPVSLGAAHGLASTCAALMRTIAPPLSGILWEFAAVTVGASWISFSVTQVVAVVVIGLVWRRIRTAGNSAAYAHVAVQEEDVELDEI